MSATTINYVHYTFNPWVGCQHAGSPGCDHCFARDMAHRFYEPCFDDNPRKLMSDAYWKQPLAWNRKAQKEGKVFRVLCGSMCDVFEDVDELYPAREILWETIKATPNLFWMLLTKRPMEIDKYGWLWKGGFPANTAIGVTVETQEQVWRIHVMLMFNAPVYWVSHEPALGRIDWPPEFLALGNRALIVTGGESGPKARPLHPEWARHDRDQCVRHGVNYWFKQWGEWAPEHALSAEHANMRNVYQRGYPPRHDFMDGTSVYRVGTKRSGRLLDGQEWNQLPEVMR